MDSQHTHYECRQYNNASWWPALWRPIDDVSGKGADESHDAKEY